MDYKLSRERETHQFNDQLARKREEDGRRASLEDERVKAGIRRATEEEIQAERRRSDEHRAKLEAGTMRARALAEAEGRIKEARDNEEVLARAARARAAEDRTTRLESIAASFRHAGDSLAAFIVDTPRVTATVGALTALAAGVYLSREGARVGAAVLQKRLLTPPLVRETSLTGAFGLAARAARALGRAPAEGASLADVVLRADVAPRVAELAAAVASTRAHGAPHRNLLFYGPPGTGKTMVAKRLARSSGLDYAVMSGGDVAPLGRDAVTELHRLLDWAERSPRGLLLFIDEADAFLASRSKTAMSEDARNALNALLFRTGEASKKLMLVLATNRPGDLDAAVVDRVDEALLFDLPDAPARRALAAAYFKKYVADAAAGAAGAAIAVAPDVDAAAIDRVADRLDGFSGRAIAKLFLSVQGAAYGRGGVDGTAPRVDAKLVDAIVRVKLDEAAAKATFSHARSDYSAGHGRLEMK